MSAINFFSNDLQFESAFNKKSDLYKVDAYKFALQQKNLDVNSILDTETKKLLRKSILQKYKMKVAKHICFVLKTAKDVNVKNKIVNEFDSFYKTCFTVNDYTVLSYCEQNTSPENKKVFTEMFQLINEFKKPVSQETKINKK